MNSEFAEAYLPIYGTAFTSYLSFKTYLTGLTFKFMRPTYSYGASPVKSGFFIAALLIATQFCNAMCETLVSLMVS